MPQVLRLWGIAYGVNIEVTSKGSIAISINTPNTLPNHYHLIEEPFERQPVSPGSLAKPHRIPTDGFRSSEERAWGLHLHGNMNENEDWGICTSRRRAPRAQCYAPCPTHPTVSTAAPHRCSTPTKSKLWPSTDAKQEKRPQFLLACDYRSLQRFNFAPRTRYPLIHPPYRIPQFLRKY